MVTLGDLFKDKVAYEAYKKQHIGEWRKDLTALMHQIEAWLQPFSKHGLKLKRYKVRITEQVYGAYEAPALELKAGLTTLHIRPIALAIIGADGRVDIQSPSRTLYALRRPGEKRWYLTSGWWDDARLFEQEVLVKLIKEIFADEFSRQGLGMV